MSPSYFLSVAVIEPFPSREATEEYLSRHVRPTLLRGLTEVCKHKPLNPCVSIQRSEFRAIHGELFSFASKYCPAELSPNDSYFIPSIVFYFNRFGSPTGLSKTIQTCHKYVKKTLWKNQSDNRETRWNTEFFNKFIH